MVRRRMVGRWVGAALAVAMLGACGDDDDNTATTTTAAAATTTTAAETTTTTAARTTTSAERTTTTAARTTTTAARTTTTAARTTTSGGTPTSGGATTSAGGPRFTSFEVQPDAPCDGENAVITMAYTTTDVETISVSVNGQPYEGGAGYDPNETSVVANVPCPAGSPPEATVRLQGCGAGNRCVESEEKTVRVTN